MGGGSVVIIFLMLNVGKLLLGFKRFFIFFIRCFLELVVIVLLVLRFVNFVFIFDFDVILL